MTLSKLIKELGIAAVRMGSGRAFGTGRRSKRIRVVMWSKPRSPIRCATRQRAAYARSDLLERRRRLTDEWAAYRSGLTGTP